MQQHCVTRALLDLDWLNAHKVRWSQDAWFNDGDNAKAWRICLNDLEDYLSQLESKSLLVLRKKALERKINIYRFVREEWTRKIPEFHEGLP